MKHECEHCKTEVDVDVAAHSSGAYGIPASTALDYSCGCSVLCKDKTVTLTTKEGAVIKLEK